MHKPRLIALAALVAGSMLMPRAPAAAQPAGVNAGLLTCRVDAGWGFVFGSTRRLRCNYARPGEVERYFGHIEKFGVDIGYLQSAVIVWTVVAPSARPAPGSLAGRYVGATGGAAAGIGAGANVLIGGSRLSVMLQPVSIEGNSGLNVAAGIAALSLFYEPRHQVSSAAR
jgi:hypothetical protein